MVCGSLRTNYRSQFSPSIMWVSDIRLKSSGLAACSLYPLYHLTGPSIVVFPEYLAQEILRVCKNI